MVAAYLLMLSVSRNLSKHWRPITSRALLLPSLYILLHWFEISFKPESTQIKHHLCLYCHLPHMQCTTRFISFHLSFSISFYPLGLLSLSFSPSINCSREFKTWVPFSCCKIARSLSLSLVLFCLLKISTDTAVQTDQTGTSCQRR